MKDGLATIETARLLLSKVDQSSREFWRNYLADPIHTLYLPRNRPYTLDESDSYYWHRLKHWREKGFGTWLIRVRKAESSQSNHGQEQAIGFCGLEYVGNYPHLDLRYGIDRHFQGQAFAPEAARAILETGFGGLALDEIYGAAEHENIASLRVLEKLGMERCYKVDFYGSLVKYFRIDKAKWDTMV